MKEISIVLRDEQWPQLELISQETGLSRALIVNSAINEYYHNYVAWKRRFSVEPEEWDRETTIPDLAQLLEGWR